MKRYKKELRLSSFENLRLCIYVIGYKNIGESIVILFKDKIGDVAQRLVNFLRPAFMRVLLYASFFCVKTGLAIIKIVN